MSTISIPLNSRKAFLNCHNCGASFERYLSNMKDGNQYCSRTCKTEHSYTSLECARCGVSFRRRKSKVKTDNNNFCSRECKGSSVVTNCKSCGKAFRIDTSAVIASGNYCSRECHYKSHGRRVTDRGDGTAEVELTQGYVAIIDAADIGLVDGMSWQAFPHRGTVYARCTSNGRAMLLHQILIPGHGLIRDHIDRDGLNNRRSNLRVVSNAENLQNQGPSVRSNSGYKGIAVLPDGRFRVKFQNRQLGIYRSISDAVETYNDAALKAFGAFAYVNVIPRSDV